jgi:hypothetical protein
MIQEWPSISGGGLPCVFRLILQVERVLASPFSLPIPETELQPIVKAYHGLDIIPITLNSFR